MANCRNNACYGRFENSPRRGIPCAKGYAAPPEITESYRKHGIQRGESCRCQGGTSYGFGVPLPRQSGNEPCGCRRENELYGLELAMAYVPWQEWRRIYEAGPALTTGTIFEELHKPFLGGGGCG